MENINDKIIIKLVDIDERLKNVEKEYVTKDDLKATKNEILEVLDIVVKKLDNIEHDQAANLAAHDRFETRITTIEKHLELA